MKRDWDLLRKMLVDIEEERDLFAYLPGEPQLDDFESVDAYSCEYESWCQTQEHFFGHLELLLESDFVDGIQIIRGSDGYISYGTSPKVRLTMAGHDLLDTIRSATLWENIKTTAKKKGVELSFDAIKVLGATALKHLLS